MAREVIAPSEMPQIVARKVTHGRQVFFFFFLFDIRGRERNWDFLPSEKSHRESTLQRRNAQAWKKIRGRKNDIEMWFLNKKDNYLMEVQWWRTKGETARSCVEKGRQTLLLKYIYSRNDQMKWSPSLYNTMSIFDQARIQGGGPPKQRTFL